MTLGERRTMRYIYIFAHLKDTRALGLGLINHFVYYMPGVREKKVFLSYVCQFVVNYFGYSFQSDLQVVERDNYKVQYNCNIFFAT